MKRYLITVFAVLVMTVVHADTSLPFDVTEITNFDEPWAMAFLPDGRMLVAEKKGSLQVVGQDGESFGSIRGLPNVDYLGHGGLGDVVLHPGFKENGLVVDYLSVDAFVDDEGVYPEIWSLGHRNPLGMTFDLDGQLWVIEMGPEGGDELNRIVRGGNYGYPIVSSGEHYDGRDIPDHDTNPEFDEPVLWWTPVISPAHLLAYSGDAFPQWYGNLLAAGLSSRAIIRIEIDGDNATEAERFPMGAPIRSVVQGPAGALWVLEDESREGRGRLLKLTPKN